MNDRPAHTGKSLKSSIEPVVAWSLAFLCIVGAALFAPTFLGGLKAKKVSHLKSAMHNLQLAIESNVTDTVRRYPTRWQEVSARLTRGENESHGTLYWFSSDEIVYINLPAIEPARLRAMSLAELSALMSSQGVCQDLRYCVYAPAPKADTCSIFAWDKGKPVMRGSTPFVLSTQ